MDLCSKRLDVFPILNTKKTSLVESLRHSFATHCLRFVKVTDNGPSFTSNKFKIFVEKYGINIILQHLITLL